MRVCVHASVCVHEHVCACMCEQWIPGKEKHGARLTCQSGHVFGGCHVLV